MSRKIVPITSSLDPRYLEPPPSRPRPPVTRLPDDIVFVSFDSAWSQYQDAATLTPDGRLHINPRLAHWLLRWYPGEELAYVGTRPHREVVEGRTLDFVVVIPLPPGPEGSAPVSTFDDGTMSFFFAEALCTHYPQFEGTHARALRFPVLRRRTETHEGVLLVNVTDVRPILPPGEDYRGPEPART